MNEYLESLGHHIKVIDVSEIQHGDVLMFNKNASAIVVAKVLAPPNVSKTKLNWYTKKPVYTAVKCSTRIDENVQTYKGWNGQTRSYTTKVYNPTPPSEHNVEKRFDLNYKTVILLDREDGL